MTGLSAGAGAAAASDAAGSSSGSPKTEKPTVRTRGAGDASLRRRAISKKGSRPVGTGAEPLCLSNVEHRSKARTRGALLDYVEDL